MDRNYAANGITQNSIVSDQHFRDNITVAVLMIKKKCLKFHLEEASTKNIDMSFIFQRLVQLMTNSAESLNKTSSNRKT